MGRADLVSAWAGGGDVALQALALRLGYRRLNRDRETNTADGSAEELEHSLPGLERSSSSVAVEAQELAPIPFWRATEVTFTEPQSGSPPPVLEVEPLTLAGKGVLEGRSRPTRPLVASARLEPALRRYLTTQAPGRQVDTKALAELWSRGEPIRRVPYRVRSAWCSRLSVVVDGSAHLAPFRSDQKALVARLKKQLGHSAVHRINFIEGYKKPWRAAGRLFSRLPAMPGEPVLALTDLGFGVGEPYQESWNTLANRRQRTGGIVLALVPCPPDRWALRPGTAWEILEWEQPMRAARAGKVLSDPEFQERAERLLGLVAFASRVEPSLLRAMRALLPASEADAGTEMDAWSHPEISAGITSARGMPPGLRRRLEKRFRIESTALRRRAIETLRAHRVGQPQELWLGEVLALAGDQTPTGEPTAPEGSLDPEEVEAARRLLFELETTLEHGGPESLIAGVRRVARSSTSERQPLRIWSDPQLQPVLVNLRALSKPPDEAASLPAGVGPEVFQSENSPRRWTLAQVGRTLRFVSAPFREEAGSPLLELEAAEPLVTLSEPHRPAEPLPLSDPLPLPPSSTLVLRTDRTAVTLSRATRGSEDLRWANAGMGRDRFGLWASFRVGGVVQRMRWIPPGRFWMGSPEEEEGRYDDEGPRHLEPVNEGFWLAETPCTQELWVEVMGSNPSEYQSTKRPVEKVSWDDCRAFFAKLEERVPGFGGQFPTEKHWEYASRAGTEKATWLGELDYTDETQILAPALEAIAWYHGNSEGKTHPAGKKLPNPWGLYDMLGNVFEWCEDPWRWSYAEEADPEGADRVVRGGSWGSDARDVRAAARLWAPPSARDYGLGFRLARGQEAAPGQGAEPEAARSAVSVGRAERAPGRGAPSSSSPSRPKGATP